MTTHQDITLLDIKTAKGTTAITRHNVEALLDGGNLFVRMPHGNWWRVRRNGMTKRWVKDAARIKIPLKAGMRAYGDINEGDFGPSGMLSPDKWRHADDLPHQARK